MEIQSDLDSLQRLYALLQTHSSSNTPIDAALDGRARLLFKNLLDEATEKALKIVSDKGDAQETGSTAVKQPSELHEEQSLPLHHTSINPEFGQNVQEELVDYNKDRRKPDESSIPLSKENSFTAEHSQPITIEQPIQNRQATKFEYRAKRCRVCRRYTTKPTETKDAMRLYHSNSFSGHYVWSNDLNTGSSQQFKEYDESKSQKHNLSFTKSRGPPLDRVTSNFSKQHSSENKAVRRQQDADVLSKEASKATDQIEIGMSAVHLGASVEETKSEEPAAQTEYSAVPSLCKNKRRERYMCRDNRQYGFSSQELPQAPRVAAEERYPLYYIPSNQTSKLVQPTRPMWKQSMSNCIVESAPRTGSEAPGEMVELPNNIQGQNVKAIVSKFESGKHELLPRQIYGVPNAVAIPVNPYEIFYAGGACPPAYPSTLGLRNLHYMGGIEDNDNCVCRPFQTYIPTDSVMSLNESENIRFIEPNQTFQTCPSKIMFADHFDKKPSQPPAYSGFHQSQRTTGVPYKDGALQSRNDRDDTSDSYTSNSRSEQTSDRDEYSSPDNSRETEYAVSRTSSETGTGSFYSDDPSYYSSTCGATLEESSRSSSASEESSSRDQAMNYRARDKSGLSRTFKSSNCKNCKKKRGTLRRLKDKLAIIFHHHHHHHHHNYDDNDNDKRRKTVSSYTTLQKQREKEAKAERAVEKTRKSLVLNKDQKSYFRGLLGGFFKHVWASEKSKQTKETPGQIFKSQRNGQKKTAFGKPYYFPMPQHNGAKLSNKAHPNHEFDKQKTHLEVLSKLK